MFMSFPLFYKFIYMHYSATFIDMHVFYYYELIIFKELNIDFIDRYIIEILDNGRY